MIRIYPYKYIYKETMTQHVQKTVSKLTMNNQKKKIVTLLKLMSNFVYF